MPRTSPKYTRTCGGPGAAARDRLDRGDHDRRDLLHGNVQDGEGKFAGASLAGNGLRVDELLRSRALLLDEQVEILLVNVPTTKIHDRSFEQRGILARKFARIAFCLLKKVLKLLFRRLDRVVGDFA